MLWLDHVVNFHAHTGLYAYVLHLLFFAQETPFTFSKQNHRSNFPVNHEVNCLKNQCLLPLESCKSPVNYQDLINISAIFLPFTSSVFQFHLSTRASSALPHPGTWKTPGCGNLSRKLRANAGLDTSEANREHLWTARLGEKPPGAGGAYWEMESPADPTTSWDL